MSDHTIETRLTDETARLIVGLRTSSRGCENETELAELLLRGKLPGDPSEHEPA